MPNENEEWFTRLQSKFAADLAADDTSPEEIAQNKAARKAEENTRWEWAQMQVNGDISVNITYRGENGTHGVGDYIVTINDERYDECKSTYRLAEPGDTRNIKKRLKDNEWVIESDYLTNTLKLES